MLALRKQLLRDKGTQQRAVGTHQSGRNGAGAGGYGGGAGEDVGLGQLLRCSPVVRHGRAVGCFHRWWEGMRERGEGELLPPPTASARR